MIKLIKNMKLKEILLILVSVVLIIFQVWLDLKLPDYMTEITKYVQTSGSTINDVLVPGGKMMLCAAFSLLSSIIVGFLVSYVSANFSKQIRSSLFEKIESFGMEEIKKFSTGSLITRTTNDITNVQMFFAMGLQLLIKAPITAVWAIFKILNKSWEWTAVTGGAVFIIFITITIMMIFVLPKFKIVQTYIDKINTLTRENLIGVRVIRAFNAEKYQEDKFEKGNSDLTETQLFTQRAMALMQPIMFFVMNVLTLAIYFVGAYLISSSTLVGKIDLFSNMIVFSSYAMQVIMAFLMLVIIFIMYPRASVSADRICEILNTKIGIKDGPGVKNTKEVGTIEFKNVSFKYPDADEYILKDISFKANKGDTVAFIGSTGSGKSTLINLVPRFYDATSGTIYVDGVDVKDYKLEELHNKLGYVPQKAVMFDSSIKENVSYGKTDHREPSVEDINDALSIAQATEFVSKMEKGIESHISSGGTNVSGGQKQRIAIARAIARKPEIYIFDDSFSALDYKTDQLLRHELKKYTKDTTSLIVAQRIGTIMNADKIVVLDEGQCVGMGTHKELLKNCEVYKEIAYSQLTKEELENA
ncbi:MAG TPA: ABC transporter ATP-binding protein [Bacilli bacterium]|nr:ABC transporter ATP-binding protein [Bacilli bacterium]